MRRTMSERGGREPFPFPDLPKTEQERVVSSFVARAEADAMSYEKAGDTEGADAARGRAERFREIGKAEVISAASWAEFSLPLDGMIEKRRAQYAALRRTDPAAARRTLEELTGLERLRDTLAARVEKAA